MDNQEEPTGTGPPRRVSCGGDKLHTMRDACETCERQTSPGRCHQIHSQWPTRGRRVCDLHDKGTTPTLTTIGQHTTNKRQGVDYGNDRRTQDESRQRMGLQQMAKQSNDRYIWSMVNWR